MKVISEESGISVAELTHDCVFAEIGVDSLLSMVIAGRFREEISIDLDTDFSLFVDLPTVKDLKDFLSADEPEAQAEASNETSPKQESSSGVSCGRHRTMSFHSPIPHRSQPPILRSEHDNRVIVDQQPQSSYNTSQKFQQGH